MKHPKKLNPITALRSLESEIRGYRWMAKQLEAERDFIANLLGVQPRDDRGRFLSLRRK